MTNHTNEGNGILLHASDFWPANSPLDAYRSLIDYRLVPIQNLTEEMLLDLPERNGIQVNFLLPFGEMIVRIHRKLFSEVEGATAYISESTKDEFCTVGNNNDVFYTGRALHLIEMLRDFDRRVVSPEQAMKELADMITIDRDEVMTVEELIHMNKKPEEICSYEHFREKVAESILDSSDSEETPSNPKAKRLAESIGRRKPRIDVDAIKGKY